MLSSALRLLLLISAACIYHVKPSQSEWLVYECLYHGVNWDVSLSDSSSEGHKNLTKNIKKTMQNSTFMSPILFQETMGLRFNSEEATADSFNQTYGQKSRSMQNNFTIYSGHPYQDYDDPMTVNQPLRSIYRGIWNDTKTHMLESYTGCFYNQTFTNFSVESLSHRITLNFVVNKTMHLWNEIANRTEYMVCAKPTLITSYSNPCDFCDVLNTSSFAPQNMPSSCPCTKSTLAPLLTTGAASPTVNRMEICSYTPTDGISFPDKELEHSVQESPVHSSETCGEVGNPKATIMCKRSPDLGLYYDISSLFVLSCNTSVDMILNSNNASEAYLIEALRSLQLLIHVIEPHELDKIGDYILETANSRNISVDTMYLLVSFLTTLVRDSPALKGSSNHRSYVKALEIYGLRVSLPENVQSVDYSTEILKLQLIDADVSEDIEIPSSITAYIPSSVLKLIADSGTVRVFSAVYAHPSLFPGEENVTEIMSLKVGNEDLSNLKDMIMISFTNSNATEKKEPIPGTLKATKTTTRCVFYDYGISQWSDRGCYLDKSSYPVSCYCDHLTNFALIVNDDEVLQQVELDIVSWIGCVLSITGLLLTIALYLISKKWKKNRPAIEMLHVCFCLLVSMVIFIVGIGQSNDRVTCVAVTALLQYFFLATWCWMGVYTRDMYTSIVKVFVEHQSHYLTKITVLAYGVPLLFVSVHVGTAVGHFDKQYFRHLYRGNDYTGSAYHGEHVCWLYDYSLYFGFLLPVGLILLHNICVVGRVIHEIAWKSNSVDSSAEKHDTRSKISLAIILTTLVGGTWIFGYLLLFSEERTYRTVMSYIFSIFNASQGFSVFLILCVRSKEMRSLWWPALRRCPQVKAVKKRRITSSNIGSLNSDFSETMRPSHTIETKFGSSLNSSEVSRIRKDSAFENSTYSRSDSESGSHVSAMKGSLIKGPVEKRCSNQKTPPRRSKEENHKKGKINKSSLCINQLNHGKKRCRIVITSPSGDDTVEDVFP